MLDVIWMDYDQLAERLGIEHASARQRAKRGQWARRKDNMGRMQVGVPAEVLEAPPERVRERSPEGDHERVLGADMSAFIARQIERLEAAVEAAQAKADEAILERDQMRDERDQARDGMREVEKLKAAVDAQVETLNAIMNLERQRAEELRADRDLWARQVETLNAALSAERGLHVVERQRMEELRAERERAAEAAQRRGLFGLFRRRA
jgi:chromosome segregation ATPase